GDDRIVSDRSQPLPVAGDQLLDAALRPIGRWLARDYFGRSCFTCIATAAPRILLDQRAIILSPNLDYHLAARPAGRRKLEWLHVRLRLTHRSWYRTGRCDRLSRVFANAHRERRGLYRASLVGQ